MTQSDSIIGEPIAVLVDGRHVRCLTCSKSEYKTNREFNLYKINIAPYNQRCHECNTSVLVQGNIAWPELFNQEGCKNCLCCLCGLPSPIDAITHRGCSDYEEASIAAVNSGVSHIGFTIEEG